MSLSLILTFFISTQSAASYVLDDNVDIGIFDETPLNFTVGPVNFSNHWIRRQRRKENILPIWYRMTGPEGPENLYIRAVYNTTSRMVHAYGVPCGYVPSIECMLQMLSDAVNSDTVDSKCTSQTPSPVIYNIPRWSMDIAIPNTQLFEIESFILANTAISTLITHYYIRHLNRTCARPFVPLHAIHKNIFNITSTYSAVNKFFLKLPEVPFFINKTNNLETIATEPGSKLIPMQKFYDFSLFLYAATYATVECRFYEDHNKKTITSKGNIETHAGTLKVSTLYISNKNPPTLKGEPIRMSSIKHMDKLLLDYVDTLALTHQLQSKKKKKNVPTKPHKRRSGSISFRGV
uniref:Envelope glycoprotein O n=1 Tax=Mastomys natalensis cytomegalovirus 1 TaxID=2973541 RepID=A0A9Y1N5S6_9BETA|nr:envelope glycoprotein O [Mastomys natalensis cytomegalovirus 1]WEG68932.1 envelope glycoprotein O [Mastomys natalensis cytomegalovirus 1]WEG71160.1 envelope glycoprotein O [Mastomys natalensis cytomegalovirus 1]